LNALWGPGQGKKEAKKSHALLCPPIHVEGNRRGGGSGVRAACAVQARKNIMTKVKREGAILRLNERKRPSL